LGGLPRQAGRRNVLDRSSAIAYFPAMDQSIPAAEANRSFSRLLREVREGQSFTITAHGRPVARIVPCDAEAEAARRRAAWADLLARLEAQPAAEGEMPRWTRDELYERD
jgi:prevent-host-death family protein